MKDLEGNKVVCPIYNTFYNSRLMGRCISNILTRMIVVVGAATTVLGILYFVVKFLTGL